MAERITVLGGTGMLGHVVVAGARRRGVDVHWTTRGAFPEQLALDRSGHHGGFDAMRIESVVDVLQQTQPTVVINCVGAVKQRAEVGAAEMIRTNSVFPHELADACAAGGARVVHLSSDCVFSGVAGDRPAGYTEDDRPDATDVYGRSKALGELDEPNTVTIRTSMIGPELTRGLGLLEWFRSASDPVLGFTEATFSGLTTRELAHVLLDVVVPRTDLHGVHQVAGPAISKHDLVALLRDRLRPELTVIADDRVRVDRRLDGSRFEAATGYHPPSWPDMVASMLDEGAFT